MAMTNAESSARFRARHPERVREYNAKIKGEALEAYGKICQCCGEGDPQFLSLDHIDGWAGKTLPEGPRGGATLYAWLRVRGYPKGFQVLCHNCNQSKRDRPACRHDSLDGLVMTGAAFNAIWNLALQRGA